MGDQGEKVSLSQSIAIGPGTLIVLCVIPGCSSKPDRSTPHGALIGHWKQIKPELREGLSAEIYVARDSAWRVESGDEPVKVRYEILEQDTQKFTLRQRVINERGAKIDFDVRFSDDRQEMYVSTTQRPLSPSLAPMVRQEGVAISEEVYRRVDDKTSP